MIKKNKKYKGVFYHFYNGEWFCELINEPFKTLKDLKIYITDYIECTTKK